MQNYFFFFVAEHRAKQAYCGPKGPESTAVYHAGVKGGSAGEEPAQSTVAGGPGGTTTLQEVNMRHLTDVRHDSDICGCVKLCLMYSQWGPGLRTENGGGKSGDPSFIRTPTDNPPRGQQREKHHSETVSVIAFTLPSVCERDSALKVFSLV